MSTKAWRYSVAGVIVLMIASLACGTISLPASSPTSQVPAEMQEEPQIPIETQEGGEGPQIPVTLFPTEASAPEPQYGKIGDVLTSGDLVLSVVGWEDVAPGQYMKPEAGKKFIAVEPVLVNAGKSPLQMDPMTFYLKDSTGQKYQEDYGAEMAAAIQSLYLELAPGERVWSKVGFQIPESATGLQFVIDMGPWMQVNIGKLFVDLGSEPSQVQMAGEMPGEKEQNINSGSQTVQIGNLAFTVNSISYPPSDKYTSPVEGNKFFVVDLTIENKGSSSVSTYSNLVTLKDANDWLCYRDTMAVMSAGGTEPSGQLAPGEKIRGQVGFQIPEDTKGLVLMLDDDPMTPGKAFLALP